MRSTRNIALAFTAVGGMCLGAAAVGVSQQAPSSPTLPPAPIHSPDDLASVFRDVSRKVLPAMVSITAQTKSVEIARSPRSSREGLGSAEQRMLREFFGENFSLEDLQEAPRRSPAQRGAGSGFIVEKSGVIITNSHVVNGADRVTVTLDDGRELVAKSWSTDPRSDLAIIRVQTSEDLPTVALGDSAQMEVGDWVLAIGNPLDVGTTVTQGIISAKGRGVGLRGQREDFIQTDAAINPGNSGGPLVNLHGEVIGVNTAIASRSGGYDGIGFAIPSNNVRWISEQLIKDGAVKRSYLGVALQPLTNDLRQQLNVPMGQGALVAQNAAKDSPAAIAGVLPGDVIVEFEGKIVKNQDDLINNVERSAPDKDYTIKVIRGGEPKEIAVELKSAPDNYFGQTAQTGKSSPQSSGEAADPQTTKLGLQLIEPSGDNTNSANKEGLIVRGVHANSPAEDAGIRVGDIIVSVSRNNVNTLAEFSEAVKDVDLQRGLLLRVNRGGAEQFVVLKLVE